MLIRSHMHDLKDVTCDVHYENYRANCIQEMTRYQAELSKKKLTFACLDFLNALFFFSPSKLAQDNRIESPIPILPLSTPDLETEKLIKMKDEEVRHAIYWLPTSVRIDFKIGT